MMARRVGRGQECSAQDARRRRDHARRFLDVAEIAADEHEEDPEYASVAVSLAVLAGIAAADAACCRALGERSRGQDHHEAERFLERIADGKEPARELRALLNLKDEANYGFFDLSAAELRRALRRARALLDFADRVLVR
jgi:hypothetical protein